MSKYKLVVFDLDGVLVDTKSSWEFVHNSFQVDNEEALAAYIGGEINDLEFMRRDISLWKDKKPEITKKDIEKILATVKMTPGVVETIRELKRNGIKCVIISGGIDILAERVGKECGFDFIFANGLVCDEKGCLTGEGISRVKLSCKDRILKRLLKQLNIPSEKCVAIGDGLVDVCMFDVAGLGIAFNPRDNYTRDGADVVIEKNDLRQILKYILE